jgi:aryl carrier-like protein
MQVCHQNLPSSMIPSVVVALDRFPLNANGKVDRARLPSPLSYPTILLTENAPQNELESELQIMWCQLLKINVVPRNANLFALGANSLLFMFAANHYYRRYKSHNIQLNFPSLFQHATIADHAKLLIGAEQTSAITSSWTTQHLIEGMKNYHTLFVLR